MKRFFVIFSFFIQTICGTEYEVLCIGSPSVDILLHVQEDFLKTISGRKGGSQLVDWDTFSQIIESDEKIVAPGGSGANTAKGLAHLGHKTALCGKMGDDPMGIFFTGCMVQHGIIPLFFIDDLPTQQIVCLITPDGQRTMRCFPGAANELAGEELEPALFKNARLVHIEGYSLYSSRLTEEAMKLAKEEGCTVSFDLASHELVRIFKEKLMELIPRHVDILFANDEEAETLTGLQPKEACARLGELCEIAVVSIGKEGCWVSSRGNTFHCPTIPVDHPVDSTGAGDLFASGFLHGYLNGLSLMESAEFGNRLGGAVVEVVGTDIPEEKWSQLLTH